MFEGTLKNKMQRDKAIRLVLALLAAGPTGTFLPEKDIDLLLKADASYFEASKETKDPSGNMAIRLSGVGATAALALQASTPAAPAAPVAKPTFTIDKGIAIPVATRGARGVVYPFDTMEVSDSFFVAATEAKPTPAKSLASTVSSASKRYAPKKFTIRAVTENNVKGARIWREA